MNEYQQKAEQYVREQLPELMNDGMMRCDICEISYNGKESVIDCYATHIHRRLNEVKAIELQHWLSVLGCEYGLRQNVELTILPRASGHTPVNFDLTTGQPATDADYQAFCEIVGVK